MAINLARNWWALALRGVCAILFGLMAFAWPQITLVVLVLLYGAFALVDGCFALVTVILGPHTRRNWWPLLVEGVTGIAIGLITLLWPGITILVLVYLIAAWAIATGVFKILAAIRLRRELEGEGWLALSGVFSIVFGLILIVAPVEGELAIAWLIGAFVMGFGVLLLALAFRLRRWQHHIGTPTGL